VQLLIEKYGGADSFRASGKIRMKLPGEQAQKQASFALMFERPDLLRMRVYRPLAPTLLEIVSNGNRRWLYVPSERTAYLSEGRQPLRVGGNHVAIPADTIAAALVVVADPRALPLLPSRIRIGEGFIRLSVTEEGGTQREIRIDSASGLATRQILVGADGATQAKTQPSRSQRTSSCPQLARSSRFG
jgi:outer membrane lipoprotein-sorting protein